MWDMIGKIAALKAMKIVWTEDLDNKSTAVYALGVDGTDYRVWEVKHPLFNIDSKQMSKKFNHGALKYEVGLPVFEPRCVWINGPFRGGEHDITIFRSALKAKIKPWKKCIADSGYESSQQDET